MDEYDKNLIIKRYQDRLKAHGEGVKALSSGDNQRQHLRFKNLAMVGNLEGKSVLDFGCGFADFYEFLKNELQLNVSYCGVDIVPEFIEISRNRFPECTFSSENILEGDFLKKHKFDYIFCSQVFNNKYINMDNEVFATNVIKSLFPACNEGLVVDFITSYVDFKEEHLNYYSPEKMYSFAKQLTKRVTLKSDYPLYEFMLLIYKDFQGWGKSKS